MRAISKTPMKKKTNLKVACLVAVMLAVVGAVMAADWLTPARRSRVEAGATVAISGRVYAFNHEPFTYTTVEVVDGAGVVVASQATTDATYSLAVPAGGTYTVRINQPGYNFITSYGSMSS